VELLALYLLLVVFWWRGLEESQLV